MRDPDLDKLTEAYQDVSHSDEDLLQEWRPYNRLATGLQRFAAGQSSIPGSGIAGAIAGAFDQKDKLAGGLAAKDETNRLWQMFNQDILAHTQGRGATGQHVKGWLRKTARIPVDKIPALQAPGFQDNTTYPEPALQELFRNVILQAKDFALSGGVGGGGSSYVLTRAQVIEMMIGLNVRQKIVLLRALRDRGLIPAGRL